MSARDHRKKILIALLLIPGILTAAFVFRNPANTPSSETVVAQAMYPEEFPSKPGHLLECRRIEYSSDRCGLPERKMMPLELPQHDPLEMFVYGERDELNDLGVSLHFENYLKIPGLESFVSDRELYASAWRSSGFHLGNIGLGGVYRGGTSNEPIPNEPVEPLPSDETPPVKNDRPPTDETPVNDVNNDPADNVSPTDPSGPLPETPVDVETPVDTYIPPNDYPIQPPVQEPVSVPEPGTLGLLGFGLLGLIATRRKTKV